MRFNNQRGMSLLLALMMVTLIVLLVVFVSAVSSTQLKLTGSSSDSARAFSAADAGIEYALSRINLRLPVGEDAASCKCGTFLGADWCPAGGGLLGNTDYCISVDDPDQPRKVTAIGRTKDSMIRRSLEVLVPVHAAVNQLAAVCYAGVGNSRSPNWICQNNASPYGGATGFVAQLAADCTGAGGGALIGGNSVLTRSDQNFLSNAGEWFVVQCYR